MRRAVLIGVWLVGSLSVGGIFPFHHPRSHGFRVRFSLPPSEVFNLLKPGVVYAYDASSLYVKAMTVDVRVDQDTSLEVEEKITVNFPSSYGKDNFEWYITKSYETKNGRLRKIVKVKDVVNEGGVRYGYSEDQSLDNNKLTIRKNGGNYSGEVNFKIVYSISKFIEEGGDYDLIAWPVVTKEQKIPIVYANVFINSPYSDVADVSCFAGDVPQGRRMCLSEYDKNQARIYTTNEVGNGKEFVYQFGVKKNNNTLKYPGTKDKFAGWVINNVEAIIISSLSITLALVLLTWLLRNKKITIKIRRRNE